MFPEALIQNYIQKVPRPKFSDAILCCVGWAGLGPGWVQSVDKCSSLSIRPTDQSERSTL